MSKSSRSNSQNNTTHKKRVVINTNKNIRKYPSPPHLKNIKKSITFKTSPQRRAFEEQERRHLESLTSPKKVEIDEDSLSSEEKDPKYEENIKKYIEFQKKIGLYDEYRENQRLEQKKYQKRRSKEEDQKTERKLRKSRITKYRKEKITEENSKVAANKIIHINEDLDKLITETAPKKLYNKIRSNKKSKKGVIYKDIIMDNPQNKTMKNRIKSFFGF